MKISRKKIDGSFERRLLTGMIVSDRFLREIRGLYRKDLVQSKPAQSVAEWCLQYFDRYEESPKQHIQDLYEAKESRLDEDFSTFVSTLLESLNDEWEHADKFNVDFLLDEAETHFKLRAQSILASTLRLRVDAEDALGFEAEMAKYQSVARPRGKDINPFTDEVTIQAAFEECQEPLFKVPGALGKVVNMQTTRQALIGLLGPEKRGKSFWLQQFALWSFRGRCNTAVFEAGDMTQPQYVARLHCNISGRPLERFVKAGEIIKVPALDCKYNQDDSCRKEERTSRTGVKIKDEFLSYDRAVKMKYKACDQCENIFPAVWHTQVKANPLTWRDALEGGKKFFSQGRGKGFKLSTHASSTLKVSDIHNQLEVWKVYEDFVPDTIVIDYPDILAPEDTRKDARDQVNETWLALRRLSQQWNACTIVATQADADSYDKKELKLKNFSNDKRKYAHVTCMYSLNQTDEEQEQGKLRIGDLVIREGKTRRSRFVTVLECREIGRPYLASYFERRKE